MQAVAGTEFNLTLEETLESSALPLILEYQVIEGIYPVSTALLRLNFNQHC